jgi:hypothetical protein
MVLRSFADKETEWIWQRRRSRTFNPAVIIAVATGELNDVAAIAAHIRHAIEAR